MNETAKVNSDDRLMTAQELAYLLHVSLPEAYKLLQAKKFPTIRIGRSVRVHRADVLRFINQQRGIVD